MGLRVLNGILTKSAQRPIRWFLSMLAAITLLAIAPGVSAAPNDLIFLMAEDAPVRFVSVTDIQNIYLGKKRTVLGLPVVAVDQSETEPIKRVFLEHVLHLTHPQYREQLLKRRFQEGAVTPRIAANSVETLKAVRETPGAIGYVYESEVGTMLGLKVVATIHME